MDYYKLLGDDFYEQLVDMLMFDAVVINEDRHYGNFGVLRDNKSGKIIAPAPVFDNGVSLLCYAMHDDFDDIEKYLKSRTNPYGRGNQFMHSSQKDYGKDRVTCSENSSTSSSRTVMYLLFRDGG